MNAPTDLPIFPLTGSLLLPGGLLPLHVFEPRYRHMVEDALAGNRHIGMVQPRQPDPADNKGEGAGDQAPDIYQIGCAGELEQHQSLPFGRHLVVLRGVCRFRIVRELPLERGYRRVEADYGPFVQDLSEFQGEIESESLFEALKSFSVTRGIEIEFDQLGEVPPVTLLNGLAMSLPLAPVEKQALLEAENVQARHAMLLALLEMGISMDEGTTLTH